MDSTAWLGHDQTLGCFDPELWTSKARLILRSLEDLARRKLLRLLKIVEVYMPALITVKKLK